MTMPRITAVWTGAVPPDKAALTVPSELFDRTPALGDLLAACGVPADVSRPDGTAPDYDFFAALIGCLPLMPGHPAARRVRRLLAALDCPSDDDAPALWRGLSGRMSAAAPEPLTVQSLADALSVSLTVPYRPDAALTGRHDLSTLSDMEAVLSAGLTDAAGMTLVFLPEDYTFTRPNPYTSGVCLKKAASGGAFSWGALTSVERDHLMTQVIRVTGSSCRRTERVLHIAGTGEQLGALTAYLADAGCLPGTVRLLTDPAASGDPLPPVSNADVRTGLWLSGGASPAALRAGITAYAERMPLLCAEGLYVSVAAPMQLTQSDEVLHAVNDLAEMWAEAQRKD